MASGTDHPDEIFVQLFDGGRAGHHVPSSSVMAPPRSSPEVDRGA
jgi:hypothetical protein